MITNLAYVIQVSLGYEGSFEVADNSIDGITWHNPDDPNIPTTAQIEAQLATNTAELPMYILRNERDKRLAETDVWALSDRTMTTEQTNYRQALRDLPANSPDAALDADGTLTGVTWPTKP